MQAYKTCNPYEAGSNAKKEPSCSDQFFFLNGFKYQAAGKGKKDKQAKSGLSFGSLSGYNSLFTQLYPEMVELIIELDCDLGSTGVPDSTRRACWMKYLRHADFPDEWPTSSFLPAGHLYGTGQFNRKIQTMEVQKLIILRMTYLWATGVKLLARTPK